MTVELSQIADEAGIAPPAADSQAARQWAMWIADALLQIRVRFGSLDGLDGEIVDFVVRKAVAEKVKRPDSESESTVSVDDASVTRRYSSSSGQISILPEWWRMLDPESGQRGRAFSIDPLANRQQVPTFYDRPDLRLQWWWPDESVYSDVPEGARDL